MRFLSSAHPTALKKYRFLDIQPNRNIQIKMATKSVARRHHYLPQVYLAAFTNTGLKSGNFFVLNIDRGHCFPTSPINVAVERDFNRVDIEGQSTDAIEQVLAPFEGKAAIAIRAVIDSQEFPNDDNLNLLLNLLGLIAVRNPKFRKSFNRSREHTVRIVSDILVSDKNIFNHHLMKMQESGETINKDVSFEDVKQFVEEGKYKIEFHPQENMRVEFHAFDKLLPILGQRTWSVLVAPNDGPEFICSDHPVTLSCKRGRNGPLGYGLKETEIFFPLGRRVGLYGVFEDLWPPVVKLNMAQVAKMNRRVSFNAERHVYSALDSYSMWHEGQVREVQCVRTVY